MFGRTNFVQCRVQVRAGHAGDVGDIAGYQRQHTRRQKADQPGGCGGQQGQQQRARAGSGRERGAHLALRGDRVDQRGQAAGTLDHSAAAGVHKSPAESVIRAQLRQPSSTPGPMREQRIGDS